MLAGFIVCWHNFPTGFKCTKESVAYLDEVRQWFAAYPVAIELRDNSWYQPEFRSSMQAYMRKQKFSLVIVDEPKKLSTTVPLEPLVTNRHLPYVVFMAEMMLVGQLPDLTPKESDALSLQ